MTFAVVTGGGTSGHVIPAKAILESLLESGYSPEDLRYVGSRRGIERTLMAEGVIQSEFLPISGLQRSLSPRGIVRNMALPLRLLRSRFTARQLLKNWKPSVVVSVGGYASEPISAAAIAAGIPLVCVSYDRSPGLATRRQAKNATVCAVAFPESSLPRAVVTGAPVRAELRHLDVGQRRSNARAELGIPQEAVVVAIVGGSLGSGVLNSLASELLMAMSTCGLDQLFLYHVAGPRDAGAHMPFVSNVGYHRTGYESRMADLYAATDVLVCRAGASTIAEVATVGIASVVIPWAGAADDHQTKNAQWLADNDAAILVSEEKCGNGEAVSAVLHLLTNVPERVRLARKSREMGELHRGNALVDVIRNAAS